MAGSNSLFIAPKMCTTFDDNFKLTEKPCDELPAPAPITLPTDFFTTAPAAPVDSSKLVCSPDDPTDGGLFTPAPPAPPASTAPKADPEIKPTIPTKTDGGKKPGAPVKGTSGPKGSTGVKGKGTSAADSTSKQLKLAGFDTTGKVRVLQKQLKVKETGLVDAATIAAWKTRITQLQTYLADSKKHPKQTYDLGKFGNGHGVDGNFGPKTKAAYDKAMKDGLLKKSGDFAQLP